MGIRKLERFLYLAYGEQVCDDQDDTGGNKNYDLTRCPFASEHYPDYGKQRRNPEIGKPERESV